MTEAPCYGYRTVWDVGRLCLYPVAASLVSWRVCVEAKASCSFAKQRPTSWPSECHGKCSLVTSRKHEAAARMVVGRVQDVSSHIKYAGGVTSATEMRLFFCLMTHQPASHFEGCLAVFSW